MVADLSEEGGAGTVAAVEAAGGEAAFVKVDVAERGAGRGDDRVRDGRDSASLDVLYNNAGIFPADDGGVTETPEPTWDRVMDVNLKGVWLGCKYGIPAMLASGGGSIVNVASFVALVGAATAQIAYTASQGRRARDDPRDRGRVRPPATSGPTRSARDPSRRPCSRS